MAKRKPATEKLHQLIVDAILNKKGHEVISLDLRKLKETPADYFVITHGDSGTHIKAIGDNVLDETEKNGFLPYHTEGTQNGEWIILDFVDVVVHIFYRDKRDFYALEELWSDGKATNF